VDIVPSVFPFVYCTLLKERNKGGPLLL